MVNANVPARDTDPRHARQPSRITQASVPTEKFLSALFLDCDGAVAESLDGGEDVVGGLGPAEGLGIGVAGIDVGSDRCLEFRGGPMGAAPDL